MTLLRAAQRSRAFSAAVAVLAMAAALVVVPASTVNAQTASPTVVVARAGAHPDIGVASVLISSGYADALVLAASSKSLGVESAEVLAGHQPGRVVLVGGTSVLGAKLETDIRQLLSGVEVERLAGVDRFDTAALALELTRRTTSIGSYVVANGWSLVDIGSAAAAVAAGIGDAVVYSDRTRLGERAEGLFRRDRPSQVTQGGGTAAIPPAVADEIEALIGSGTVLRLGGKTRIETSELLAERGLQAGASSIVVSNAWSTEDAGIAAATASGLGQAVVLYSEPGTLTSAAASLASRHRPETLFFIGGDDAVSESVANRLASRSGGARTIRLSGANAVDKAAEAARNVLRECCGSPTAAFARVSAGAGHACGVTTAGSVHCWGDNTYRQAQGSAGQFSDIGAGLAHSCAHSEDGHVTCWGANRYGQADPPDIEFETVSVGYLHTCGKTRDGRARCWGVDFESHDAPQAELAGIDSGGAHTCAITASSTLACWGDDSKRQLRHPSGEFKEVSAGGQHSCALKPDGTLACWGDNTFGQTSAPSGKFKSVSAGRAATCGIRTNGRLACWGNTALGPVPDGRYESVSTGWSFACAIRDDDRVRCWGETTVLGYR